MQTPALRLPARIGVIGAGAVSRQYLPNLLASPQLTVTAVSDIDTDAARRLGDEFGIPARDTEQLLAGDDVDIVLNLTPIAFHAQVSRRALEAGKHVYSEKSLAGSVEDARALLDLARARGLVIAGAPDTLLGTSFPAARRALESGVIGAPLNAVAVMLRFRHPGTRYFANHNALFDMAPYYVSALATLFGPIAAVTGTVGLDDEEPAEAGVALGFSSVLEFTSGFTATFSMRWGSVFEREVAVLDVYGATGVLRFANPNNFGDPVFVRQHDDEDGVWCELAKSRQSADLDWNLRGLGVVDMAEALAAGRPPRARGDLAGHVVDAIAGIIRSSQTGATVRLTTTFDAKALAPEGGNA